MARVTTFVLGANTDDLMKESATRKIPALNGRYVGVATQRELPSSTVKGVGNMPCYAYCAR